MIVAGLYNTHRTDKNDKYWTPWDFMPDPNYNAEREKIIATLKSRIPMLTPAQLLKFREDWTRSLTEKGRKDVGQIMERVFKGVTV